MKIWGYLSALTVAILFGVWFSLDKTLLGYLHPIVLASATYLIASCFLFIINFSPLKKKILKIINSKSKVEDFITKKEYGILFLTAIFGSVIAPAIYLNGLNRITAVNAALLANVEILFIILIGVFFLKEHVKRKDIVGFVFLLIGAIFLSTNNLQNIHFDASLFGSILVIVSCFFWSMDTSLSKFLSHKSNIIYITALKCAIGGLILLLISISLGLSFSLPLDKLPLLLFIGLVCLSISLPLIYFAIRIIGSTRTGSIFALSSLFGAITAFLVLGEPLTVTQLSFGVLMIIGVYILYMGDNDQNV
ncbi:MAG: DMT family transporter [Methanobacterium sp.]|uniref:DMT family transporter n=1 Tax=Methanobacterium sp. TaxID=2164 RepID=UPI003D6469E4|nr:DMT family transporter [Methanobacterium sp.]